MHTANRNTFSFIPDVCYFSNHPSIASPKGQSLITREHQHICPILLEFCHSSPPLPSLKTIKILRSIRKFKHVRLTLTGLCIFLMQMLKRVSISLINPELVRTLYLMELLSNL